MGTMKQMAIAALGAILLALFGWAGTSIIDNGERLSAVEVDHKNLGAWLERLEGKVDKVLERLPAK
jgi:hypothetical protein